HGDPCANNSELHINLLLGDHVARLERLLGFLSPEEQLVLDRMLVHPYKRCTLDLMEELHCEMSSVYRLRAAAIEKLLHLRYGAGAGE
ncbi:MAG: hypothetical protein J6A79_15680, partial [Clostridia bacterium]|nr:hypothetical protein [Clostridia bacterium]